MVVLHRDPVPAQGARNPLTGVARAGIDDRAALVEPSESFDQDSESVLVATHLLDVVSKVWTNDARAHDLELATECLGDPGSSRRCRGRGHSQHRRALESLEHPADEQVVGPEVVPPHADAVHLVDHDEPHADRPERLDERAAAEPLRRRVEQSRPAGGNVVESSCGLRGLERRVDECRGRSDLRR